jgi:hypothetical protein
MKISRYLAAGLTLAAAYAPGLAIAQSEPVVLYGRLNVARESNDRSVIGFRGAGDLGDGVQALFQVEGTLAPDTGARSPAARDIHGRLGRRVLGTHQRLFLFHALAKRPERRRRFRDQFAGRGRRRHAQGQRAGSAAQFLDGASPGRLQ